MDTQTVVSVLSVRAAFRLSPPDWVYVDGALSVASGQKISGRLSVKKASHYGEPLSTRSFAHAGGTLSGCDPASYADVLSVVIQSSVLMARPTWPVFSQDSVLLVCLLLGKMMSIVLRLCCTQFGFALISLSLLSCHRLVFVATVLLKLSTY
jgi:hypothetical protein